MRLLSLRLENVRQFVAPVEIAGIGPGLNVLAAPNESGKSTVFDAIHALFFLKHRSTAQPVKALQPHAGGAPDVTAAIETGDGVFTVSKRWLARPRAEVRQGDRLLAQSDEAEQWIEQIVADPKKGGPAGLLWVRQGALQDKDPNGEAEARRGLMGSIEGEIAAMTGGRRMDRALARCEARLGELRTSTGRARTGGPLKCAEDAVAALEASCAALSGKVAELEAKLDARRGCEQEFGRLTRPEADAARRDELAEAAAALAAAESHAGTVEEATARLRAREGELAATLERMAAIRAALAEHETAADALRAAAEALEDCVAARRDALAARDEARTAHAEATRAFAAADRMVRHVERFENARQTETRRVELTERLWQAEALRREAESAKAEAATGPEDALMTRLRELARAVREEALLRKRRAPGITVRYEPGRDGAVRLDGLPLSEGERHALPDGGALSVPGIGRIIVDPGDVAGSGTLEEAEAALAAALHDAGFDGIDAAEAAEAQRQRAAVRQRDAEAALRLLAPGGVEALRKALADLPGTVEALEGQPGLPAARDTVAAAEARRDAAAAALRTCEDAARTAEMAWTAADATHRAAQERHRRAAGAPALADEPDAALAALDDRRAALEGACEVARRDVAALLDAAPDLDAARTRHRRLAENDRNARARIDRLRSEIDTLNGEIRQAAGEGVEEHLRETEAELARARATRDRLAFQADALTLLRDTLRRSREAALDRYLAPILGELKPLLHALWPGSDIAFDADALVPTHLSRRGRDEEVGILSGGTREQVALLVRIAFARLLAASGRHAPLILDDAVVFTDDQRIETLFDTFHRHGETQQILVFSCRQEAFGRLGGTVLSVEAAAAAASEEAA